MFGLFKSTPDESTLFLWVCSSAVLECMSCLEESRQVDRKSIEANVVRTAGYNNCKLSREQLHKLQTSCIAIMSGFHSRDPLFLSAINQMAKDFQSGGKAGRESIIEFGEYLQSYGIRFFN